MKRPALILTSVIAAAFLSAVGWWFGFQQRLLTEAYAVPFVDKELNEAAVLTRLIDSLESGEIEDARHMLVLQLNGHIISINNLLDYTDARTRSSALMIFAGINEYRAKHPAS